MRYLLTLLLALSWSAQAQEPQSPGTSNNEAVSAVPSEQAVPETKPEEAKPAPPAETTPSEVPPAKVPSPAPEKKSSPKPQSSSAPKSPSSKGLGRLADLKLSPEQTTAMIEARKTWNTEQEKALRDEVKAAKEELANAMIDNSSSDEVRKKFMNLQKKYTDLQTLKFEKSLRIREILNLEQRKKFQEIRTKQPDP